MQRFLGPVVAIVFSVMYASSAVADDVANALADALQDDDLEYPGVRAGDGFWLLTGYSRLQPDSQDLIGEYLGAGVVYRSASTQFGIAVGVAELGAPFERTLSRSGREVADREAVYEMSWRIELSAGLTLRSDVQYIRNPGLDATIDSAWTFALRFELDAR